MQPGRLDGGGRLTLMDLVSKKKLKLFSGQGNPDLAAEIAAEPRPCRSAT